LIEFAGCIQTHVHLSPREFLATVKAGLAQAPGPCLAVLPELPLGGFHYESKGLFAEATPGLLDRLQEMAAAAGVSLAGTFWEREGDEFYNSLFLLGAGLQAPLLLGRKNHLFPMSREEQEFSPGGRPIIPLEHRGLRIGAAICFEIRFPEVFRAQNVHSPDLFIVCSQWPASRAGHLTALAMARAIENQAFVLSCNAVGPSGLGQLGGNSQFISPWGEILFQLGETAESRFHHLDKAALERATRHFQSRVSPWHETRFSSEGKGQG